MSAHNRAPCCPMRFPKGTSAPYPQQNARGARTLGVLQAPVGEQHERARRVAVQAAAAQQLPRAAQRLRDVGAAVHAPLRARARSRPHSNPTNQPGHHSSLPVRASASCEEYVWASSHISVGVNMPVPAQWGQHIPVTSS